MNQPIGTIAVANNEHNWIEFWAVFTEANGTTMANEYHSEWKARKFKQVTEKMIEEHGTSGCKVWIEHGYYDGAIFPDFRKDMTKWNEHSASIHSVQIK